MDLTLNDEQEALRTATADWCRDNMALEDARSRSPGLWAELEAMGWTSMTAPGMDLDHATEAVVFAELGRCIAPIGLLSTAAAHRWFADGFVGKAALALPAEASGDMRVLDPGGSTAVLMWQIDKLCLFVVPEDAPHAPTIDLSTDQCRRSLTVSVQSVDAAAPLHLQLLAAAYAVGCADAARDMAADYAKLRQQFDRPIGWFQALKHICSDMAVRAAVARSQLYYAACALDAGDADAAFHIAAAKRLADQAALDNGRANIQVHGGIGMTDEAAPHLCLKRAHLLQFIAPPDAALLLKDAA
ncbi:MAG TPA: acyl-CoA dehydrogenase family protein [Sphingopyxis sp.]|jgi:alkylation response protein AidB-like acyl-CoA dehydrogenase|uniref:acyl-CoA dehydrogenase family protein n=1 Tax=Sphingopyxis sp. TaxID=1908224 RepID=UPI002E0F9F52|nr:acyl-CoA dehydrogenase family protein [Sphingopyxis sp.]